jgi:PIN domain nuclease of toxin-antitoxin system
VNRVVLDASALICLLNDEPGADRVAKVMARCVVGATNLAEVVSKLRERGLSQDDVREALGGFDLDVRPLTAAQAFVVGDLRPATRPLGLSLGDRACLALAAELGADLYTTDAALARTETGVTVIDVRLVLRRIAAHQG